jgi:hypothetical protein
MSNASASAPRRDGLDRARGPHPPPRRVLIGRRSGGAPRDVRSHGQGDEPLNDDWGRRPPLGEDPRGVVPADGRPHRVAIFPACPRRGSSGSTTSAPRAACGEPRRSSITRRPASSRWLHRKRASRPIPPGSTTSSRTRKPRSSSAPRWSWSLVADVASNRDRAVSTVGTAVLLGAAAARQTAVSCEGEDAGPWSRSGGGVRLREPVLGHVAAVGPADQFCSWAMPRADSKHAATCGWRAETAVVMSDHGKLSSGSTSGRKTTPTGGSAQVSVGSRTSVSRSSSAVTAAPSTLLEEALTVTPA